jgi:hypothetical protein
MKCPLESTRSANVFSNSSLRNRIGSYSTYHHRHDRSRAPRGSPHQGPTMRTHRYQARKTRILLLCLVQMTNTRQLLEAGSLSAVRDGAFPGAAQRWNTLVGHSWEPRMNWTVAEVRGHPFVFVPHIFPQIRSTDQKMLIVDNCRLSWRRQHHAP